MNKSVDFLYLAIPHIADRTVLPCKSLSCSKKGSNSSNSYSLFLGFLELNHTPQSSLSPTPFQKESPLKVHFRLLKHNTEIDIALK